MSDTSVEASSSVDFAPLEWESYEADTSKPRRDELRRYIVTAPLAGAAYLKARKSNRCLTHAVEINETGEAVRVLCGKVKLENILDDAAVFNVHPLDCDACVRKFGVDPQADDQRSVEP